MFNIALLLCVFVPVIVLILELRRARPVELVLSHFWYFTFLFLTAFPLRAFLLENGTVEAQIWRYSTAWNDPEFLSYALIIALSFWCIIYAGYKTASSQTIAILASPSSTALISLNRVKIGYCFFAVLAIAAIIYIGQLPQTVVDPAYIELKRQQGFSWSRIYGSDYIESRKGVGIFWSLPEFFMYAFTIAACVFYARADARQSPAFKILFILSVALVFWISLELVTRRMMAGAMLIIIALYTLHQHRVWPLALFAVLGTVFAAPVFNILRRLPGSSHIFTDPMRAFHETYNKIINRNFLESLSGSFEGVEHFAHYLSKASWVQLFSGVDYGLSWVFNAGLGLLPRALWELKPVVYGGFSQFQWLYPETFIGDQATLSVPPSFAVDFAFGFGIPIGLVMAFYLGRFFAACQKTLFTDKANIAALAISLYTYVFVFNILRSGTIHGQSLILLAVFCVVMLGLRNSLQGYLGIFATTFTIRHPAITRFITNA
jgi:hypothetical protein